METKYSHITHCDNCNIPNLLLIPKGIRIQEFVRQNLCSNCGCKLREERRDYGLETADYGGPVPADYNEQRSIG